MIVLGIKEFGVSIYIGDSFMNGYLLDFFKDEVEIELEE